MGKAEKIEKVADLRERIEESEAVFLTDYRGLTVADATELRRSLLESGARFTIVKNTLMRRAAEEAGIQALEAVLQGPTAVAFVVGDPVGAAKKMADAARRFPSIALKGAYMEGKVLSAEQAQALATLESRPAMLARVAGLAKGEMARAASMLQALQGRFRALLEAYRERFPVAERPTAERVAEASLAEASAATEANEREVTEAANSDEEGKE